jgi:hypothetical protein
MIDGGTKDSRDWGRRVFSAARRRTIFALVEALFSSEDTEGKLAPARPELAERITDEFDLLIGAGSVDLRRGYLVLAWLIDWAPVFFIGVLSRASRLPLARRLEYLDRLEHAKIALVATLLVAFKIPLTILAFEQSPELGLTGFDRDTLATRRLVARKSDEAQPASPARSTHPAPRAQSAAEEVKS